MPALHTLDLLVMGAYFSALLAIGYAAMRSGRARGEAESFLAAERNVGLFQSTASTAATDLGGGFSIAMGGLGFTLGLSGSWLVAVSGLSVVMASFLVVPKVKRWADRTRGLTTGDLFEARYDRKTGMVAALLVGLSWFAFVGGQIVAGGKLLQVTVGIEPSVAIVAAGAIILAYTAMGGLKAVIVTDVFQMAVLLVGVIFVLVPLGLHEVGGVGGLVEKLEAAPETQPLLDWTAAGWKTIVGWFLAVFPVWFISIAGFQRIVAARDESTARWAFFLTGVPLEWPLFAVGSTLVGMFARVLVPDLADPELATPTMILTLLPPGLAGLVIAAYVAALMSTADSCLIGPVAIVVNDFYKKRIRPQASDRELIRMARAATLVLGIAAIALAYASPRVLDMVLYAYTFGAAGLFFPMLGLLFWKRTTATGAFWSVLAGGSSAVIWTIAGEPFAVPASYPGWAVSLLVLVVVSLTTSHGEAEDRESFQ